MAIIEHDFENGLTVRNGTIAADYKKFYQNVYPANGAARRRGQSGRYRCQSRRLSAHDQPRQRLQPDRLHLQDRDRARSFHTVGFGTEFGRQTGVDIRNTGVFPNGTNTIVQNPFAPTYFGPVTFVHHFTDVNIATASRRRTPTADMRLNIESGLCPRHQSKSPAGSSSSRGARFDRFDMSAMDMNTNINRNRVDNLVSPQAAVIIKPMEKHVGLHRLQHFLSAGVRRPVQFTDRRHADSAAAEIREHRDRHEVEHQSEAAVLDGGLQS